MFIRRFSVTLQCASFVPAAILRRRKIGRLSRSRHVVVDSAGCLRIQWAVSIKERRLFIGLHFAVKLYHFWLTVETSYVSIVALCGWMFLCTDESELVVPNYCKI